jgi:hypothetical protein
MALTTYSELKTAVVAWMNVPTASLSTTIDDLVTIAEARIFRETRTKDTEAVLSGTITAGVITVPSDYIALKFAYLNTTPSQVLERRNAEWILSEYPIRSSAGRPKYIAREAGNFIFGPYADSGYTMGGVYYKKLAALSTTNHALFTNNPDLYLFGCLAESEILIGRDPRLAIWESKYQKILSDVNGVAKAEDVSGGSIRMRTM